MIFCKFFRPAVKNKKIYRISSIYSNKKRIYINSPAKDNFASPTLYMRVK